MHTALSICTCRSLEVDSETLWMSGPLWDTSLVASTLHLEGSITSPREHKSVLNHFLLKPKYHDSLGLRRLHALITGLKVWWIEQ